MRFRFMKNVVVITTTAFNKCVLSSALSAKEVQRYIYMSMYKYNRSSISLTLEEVSVCFTTV